MKSSFLIFDVIYLVASFVVYAGAGTLAYIVVSPLSGEHPLSIVVSVILGYFLFLHFFVLLVALLRKLFQKPLKVGVFPVGMNRDYIAWGLNSVFHGIVIASPFAPQLFFIFYLNRLYYTLMGMKLPVNSLIGTDATIRQPELIEIGSNTVIGIGCTLVAHFSPNRKKHSQGKIIIGSNTLIGAHSGISPHTRIGDNVVIGYGARIYPHARVGNNVYIGPAVTVNIGAHIPDNVVITGNTIIERGCRIRPGEEWGGYPASCLKKATDNS